MRPKEVDLAGTNLLFVAYFYPPAESTEVPGSMRTIKFVRHLRNGAIHVLTRPPEISSDNNALTHLSLPVNGESIHRVRSLDIFRLLLAVRAWFRKQSGQVARNTGNPDNGPVFKAAGADAQQSRSRLQQCKDFIYNACYFPDQAGPWILPAVLTGWRLVRRHNLDCIVATGSPWSGLVAGLLISRLSRKPLIADFRDPWINNPFHTSKGALLDGLGQWLEKQVVHRAAAISLNTDALREEFLSRYPDMDPDRFFVMPNGIDLSDVQPETAPTPERPRQRQTLSLCHAGFLYGVRNPASLLEAIRIANRELAPAGRRIVFRQIGNVSLDYDLREVFSDLIEQGALILEPARPYQECLASLASADILVNIQSGTKTQIPSKLYDYLAMERPLLHITPADGALGRLVSRYQLGIQVDFGDTEKLVSHLLERSAELAENSCLKGYYPNRDQFLIENITRNLVSRIHQVTGKASV